MQKQHSESEQTFQLTQALAVLQRGGTVGYPSETVWGLAALPFIWSSVERLYQAKGRVQHKPVQLSCSDLAQAQRWLRPGQPEVELLARFWPGPLTLLAEAAAACPEWLAPGGVVGLRVPAHPLAQALLTAAGGTLATTSLNPSGLPPAVNERQAREYELADFVLPGHSGESASEVRAGLASTVFELRTRRVLRQGAISEAELLEALR